MNNISLLLFTIYQGRTIGNKPKNEFRDSSEFLWCGFDDISFLTSQTKRKAKLRSLIGIVEDCYLPPPPPLFLVNFCQTPPKMSLRSVLTKMRNHNRRNMSRRCGAKTALFYDFFDVLNFYWLQENARDDGERSLIYFSPPIRRISFVNFVYFVLK